MNTLALHLVAGHDDAGASLLALNEEPEPDHASPAMQTGKSQTLCHTRRMPHNQPDETRTQSDPLMRLAATTGQLFQETLRPDFRALLITRVEKVVVAGIVELLAAKRQIKVRKTENNYNLYSVNRQAKSGNS